MSPALRGPPAVTPRGTVAISTARNEEEREGATMHAMSDYARKIDKGIGDPSEHWDKFLGLGQYGARASEAAEKAGVAGSTTVGDEGSTAEGSVGVKKEKEEPHYTSGSSDEEPGASGAASSWTQARGGLASRRVPRPKPSMSPKLMSQPKRGLSDQEKKLRLLDEERTREYRKTHPLGFDLSAHVCSDGKLFKLGKDAASTLRHTAQELGIPMSRHGLVDAYRLLRHWMQTHPRFSPGLGMSSL